MKKQKQINKKRSIIPTQEHVSVLDLLVCIITLTNKHNVKLEISNTETVKLGNIKVAGYWDEESKTIAIAVARKDWIPLLIHEFCHFLQWTENKFRSQKDIEASDDIDDWLNNKIELTKKQISDKLDIIARCELDCEKRTAKMMKEFNVLSAEEIEEFIQKANAYIYGHEAIKQKRSWFKKPIYGNKKITSLCPKKFTKSLKPDKKIFNLIMKECF